MEALKDFFKELAAEQSTADDAIEVYADSVKQALELAAEEFDVGVSMLDYNILEKGTEGIFGIGRKPYHVLVKLIPEEEDDSSDIDKLAKKLAPAIAETMAEPDDIDASYKIRITKSGIWFTAYPPKGDGLPLEPLSIQAKLGAMKVNNADLGALEKAVGKMSGTPVRLGDWEPNSIYDGKMKVELASDEMSAAVHFVPPRFNGRHMEYQEVLDDLRSAGIVFGYRHEQIQEYLEKMDYSKLLLAAEGTKPVSAKDAYIDYKVRIDKSRVKLEEDESGKVDFRNLDLLENVTAGQLLAVKEPPGKGAPGRTVTDKLIPVKPGKDITMEHGKGTILSDDKTEITAEINGQVVFKRDILMVDPVHIVNGDVGLESGNIDFLGSVVVAGNVQDNFHIKASGNIEVRGTVQKAFLESDGDIIVYQGISGRNEAKIESTGGSVLAKFIQNANISAGKDVHAPEGIMHSNIDAENRILCNGRRARIVGGLIRAENEINARFIGANASTKTEVRVGINPKLLQYIVDLENQKSANINELDKINKELPTLVSQKAAGKLTEEKAQLFQDMSDDKEKLEAKNAEINAELEERNSYLESLEHKGKVCAEEMIFPGVDIFINTEKFAVKDEYRHIKFSMEGNEIKLSAYEPPEITDQRMVTTSKRR
ncbi:MAG: FapA family protein [Spirochaetia bacterium]|jgi:uncharacterized protein (DUF342 family)|nr:FapA family protein [Spirochaetia bacterium]